MIIHTTAHLMYQQFREIWWGVGVATSGAGGGGGGGVLGGAALLDRRSQSAGAKASIVLKSILAVMRDAKIHLEHIHVRVEDDGRKGSLAWTNDPVCMGLTIREIVMGKSMGTGSAHDPFPDMPKEAEWDEKSEAGVAAIDQTLHVKGLHVYFAPLGGEGSGEGEGGGEGGGGGGGGVAHTGADPPVGTSGADPVRIAQLLASFGAPFQTAAGTGGTGAFGTGPGTLHLLDGMELSARVYAAFDMGMCFSSGPESLPWRLRHVKMHLLAPYTSVELSQIQLLFVLRMAGYAQTHLQRLQRAALLPRTRLPPAAAAAVTATAAAGGELWPGSVTSPLPNLATARWKFALASVRRDLLHRRLATEAQLAEPERWRSYFQTWVLAARYVALRRLLYGTPYTTVFRTEGNERKGEAPQSQLHEGEVITEHNPSHLLFRHRDQFPEHVRVNAEAVLHEQMHLPAAAAATAEAARLAATSAATAASAVFSSDADAGPPDIVLRALYAMQLELDGVLPPTLSASCRLIAAEYLWAENHVAAEPDTGCLLVTVADMTGARPLMRHQFGLDAVCHLTVKDAGVRSHLTTDTGMHHPERQLVTWGQVMPFTLSLNQGVDAASGKPLEFGVRLECKQTFGVMDQTIGEAKWTDRADLTSDPRTVQEHRCEIAPAPPKREGAESDELPTTVRLFIAWVPEGPDSEEALVCRAEMVRRLSEDYGDFMGGTGDAASGGGGAKAGILPIPDVDLSVDVGIAKLAVVTHQRVVRPGKGGGEEAAGEEGGVVDEGGVDEGGVAKPEAGEGPEAREGAEAEAGEGAGGQAEAGEEPVGQQPWEEPAELPPGDRPIQRVGLFEANLHRGKLHVRAQPGQRVAVGTFQVEATRHTLRSTQTDDDSPLSLAASATPAEVRLGPLTLRFTAPMPDSVVLAGHTPPPATRRRNSSAVSEGGGGAALSGALDEEKETPLASATVEVGPYRLCLSQRDLFTLPEDLRQLVYRTESYIDATHLKPVDLYVG